MASSSSTSALFLLSCTLVLLFDGSTAAKTHVVGDSIGWMIPSTPNAYNDWAKKQTFLVGDELVFQFLTDSHDVTQVPKSSYDGCTTTGVIGKPFTTGPATVKLTSAGTFYYICGFPGHCDGGQKVAVTVKAATPSAATPAPSPRTASPAAGPATAPPTSSPAGAAGPGTASTPSLSSTPGSAAPALISSVAGVVMSAAGVVALLLV